MKHHTKTQLLKIVPSALQPVVKLPYYGANWIFARKPTHVIVGTGRCGTKFTSRYLSDLGITSSHEAYYTPEGPRLRNKNRNYKATIDVSWLAAPYLPQQGVRVVHQVRNPLGVISSFYKLGFFDPRYYSRHKRYIDFIKPHFDLGTSPLQSCVRWYIDWNVKCEKLTSNRIQLEKFMDGLTVLADWLEIDPKYLTTDKEVVPVNVRDGVIRYDENDLLERISALAEYVKLCDTAERYGYVIP